MLPSGSRSQDDDSLDYYMACEIDEPPHECTQFGRRSTFDDWPQYLFPSKWNNLAADLQTPYAFSHHNTAFYWTKDDAKELIRWNINAQPPCLNCIVLGEARAKACDRLRRQEQTYGISRCCTCCEKRGLDDACIETIEIRIDGMHGLEGATEEAERHFCIQSRNDVDLLTARNTGTGRLGRSFMDDVPWIDSERALRKEGLVLWRPINLHVGNTEAKTDLMREFEAEESSSLTRSTLAENEARFVLRIEDINFDYDGIREDMEAQVVRWDSEDLAGARPVPGSTNVAGRQASELIPNSEAVAEGASTSLLIKNPNLKDLYEHWSSQLARSQAELYAVMVKGSGRQAAEAAAATWERDSAEVISQIQVFLEHKTSAILQRGLGIEEANRSAAAALTNTARYWLRRLTPDIMTM